MRAQFDELRSFLNPFGCRLDVQRMRKLGNCTNDCARTLTSEKVLNEASVDLQFVEREALEIAERRISSAEIIERDSNAKGLEAVEKSQCGFTSFKDTNSVISISSRSGARPLVESDLRIVSGSEPRRNWIGETLTATRMSHGHRAACSQASRMTHAPIGTISPVSSAMVINSAGDTRPRRGWFHRIKASKEQILFCSRSNNG